MLRVDLKNAALMQAQEFVRRSQAYVHQYQQELTNTLRRADTCFPAEISRMLKSAMLQDIMTREKGDIFVDLADFEGNLIYEILDRQGDSFTMQSNDPTDTAKHDIHIGHTDNGLQITYQDVAYDEFSRTGNLYKHIDILHREHDISHQHDLDQGLATPLEGLETKTVINTHDMGESLHTDIESILKNSMIRHHEHRVFTQRVYKHYPHTAPYILSLHNYTKSSSFKRSEYQQFLTDTLQFQRDSEQSQLHYSQAPGLVYECLNRELEKIIDPTSRINYAEKSLHPLETQRIRALLTQHRSALESVPAFLTEHTDDIHNSSRYQFTLQRNSRATFDKQIDKLKKNIDTIDSTLG